MAQTKYDLLIQSSANDSGIPPAVLWGLLSHESGFQSDARGDNKDSDGYVTSTDRGIAQINNKYHSEVSDSQADDPNFAIPWAAKELGRLSTSYGGDVFKFLTAYNRGHYEDAYATWPYAKKVLAEAAKSPFGSGQYVPEGNMINAADTSAYAGKYGLDKPVLDKLTDYWDDQFPASRGVFDPYKMRIGDMVTYIPPEMIQVSVVNNVNQFTALRQKQSVKTKNGSEVTQLQMNFYFNGEDQINGQQMIAPEGGYYYMDGLRSMLAQFKRLPFLPVENEFLNRTLGIYAIAFSSVSVETVEGFPGLLNVSCVFYEFDPSALIGLPSYIYDKLIMWPVFRWWYQQMLVENGKSSTRLSLVHTPLSQDIGFKMLDESFLTTHRNTLKNKTSQELDAYFIPVTLAGDYVITSFNATFGNLLTPMTLDMIGKPMFQYFGGLDTRIWLTFETTSPEFITQLKNMNETMEHYSRMYRNRFVGGYLQVKNDLVNMMGVNFCMIEQLSIATVPGYPGLYTVNMGLISFDKTQIDGERLDGWNQFKDQTIKKPTLNDFPGQDPAHFSNFIVQELLAEQFLETLELYPDLELPTYDYINSEIVFINRDRAEKGLALLPVNLLKPPSARATYVDPDFYMSYPNLGALLDGGADDVLGPDFDAMLDSSPKNIQRLNKKTNTIESKDIQGNQKAWASSEMTKGKWEALRDKAMNSNHLRDSWSYRQNPISGKYDPENYTVDYIRTQPAYEDLKGLMTYDAFKYSKRGTMLRAFPTYVLMIIDEGQWVNARKIWNNYYAYHVVNDIAIVQDRKNPADTAYVTLSNVYGSLNYQSKPPYHVSEYLKKFGDGEVGQLLSGVMETFDYMYPNLADEQAKFNQRAKLLQEGFLQPGARVHIRLGYGSTASTMPTVFNGVVSETDAADEMSIVCQGDGVELINSDIDASGKELNSWWVEGDSGQAMVQYFMTKRSNDWVFNSSDRIAAALGRNSQYGIEHFGYTRQWKDTDWGHSFWNNVNQVLNRAGGWSSHLVDPSNPDLTAKLGFGNQDPYDIVKNIYSTSGVLGAAGVTNANAGETINTFLAGKSPWDVLRLMAKVHTDYVVYPRYHNFHSTLFFGMPHWLCKQGWVLPDGAKGDVINDYKDLTKPFSQIHFVNAMEDILHNGIKAVGRDLLTHCYALYYKGNGEKTGPTAAQDVFADQRIRPELQKSKMVDSTIVQSYFANWLWQTPLQFMSEIEGKVVYVYDEMENFFRSIMNATEQEIAKIKGYFTHKTEAPTRQWEMLNAKWDEKGRGEKQAMTFAISTIADSFKDMYQGSLLIIGDPAIKPYDFICLNDFYTQMHGTCEVQRVVHSMSMETGFVTEITPDLAVAQIYGESYVLSDSNPKVSSKTDGIRLVVELSALASVRVMRLALGWATLRTYNNAKRLGTVALKLGSKAQGIEMIGKAVQAGRESYSVASELPAFAKMGKFVKGARTSIKAALTGIEVATIDGTIALGPEVWVGVVIEAGIFMAADMVIDAVLDWLNMDHNCIKIFPLYYKGHPYVAGINGHKNLIPGRQDEFAYGDPDYTLEGDPKGAHS